MKNLYKLVRINQSNTTPYHPMGTGLSEHFNRTLLMQEDWMGTQGISISLCLLSLFAGIPLLGAAGRNPGHGTRIARGLVWYNY